MSTVLQPLSQKEPIYELASIPVVKVIPETGNSVIVDSLYHLADVLTDLVDEYHDEYTDIKGLLRQARDQNLLLPDWEAVHKKLCLVDVSDETGHVQYVGKHKGFIKFEKCVSCANKVDHGYMTVTLLQNVKDEEKKIDYSYCIHSLKEFFLNHVINRFDWYTPAQAIMLYQQAVKAGLALDDELADKRFNALSNDEQEELASSIITTFGKINWNGAKKESDLTERKRILHVASRIPERNYKPPFGIRMCGLTINAFYKKFG